MVEKFVHAVKNAIDPREETDPETRIVSNRDVIDHREEADPEARTVSNRDVQEETDADRVEVEDPSQHLAAKGSRRCHQVQG